MKTRVHLARASALAAVSALLAVATLTAGPFSPPGGLEGSSAIAKDDPRLTAWATGVAELTRGLAKIDEPGWGHATFGDGSAALGPPSDDVYDVVSLGDGGSITLTFAEPITNGDGWDFAIFENSFLQFGDTYFCELAFVEVSSDGVNFFRFPAQSLTPTETQLGGFAGMDPTHLHNLAGRDPLGWGTPFDLADLAGAGPLLDLGAVTHVRLVDVVGSIDPAHASFDSLGNIINDPWPTPFPTGGFDLMAVGVRGRATGASSFDTWRAARFTPQQLDDPAISGLAVDPDGNGLPNLLEYALGIAPLDSASARAPAATLHSGETGLKLRLGFRRVADPALIYTVEASGDLIAWSEIFRSNGAANTADVVEVEDSVALSPGTRRFLRLKVELP